MESFQKLCRLCEDYQWLTPQGVFHLGHNVHCKRLSLEADVPIQEAKCGPVRCHHPGSGHGFQGDHLMSSGQPPCFRINAPAILKNKQALLYCNMGIILLHN